MHGLWRGRRATAAAAAAAVVDLSAELVDLDDFQFEFHEEVVYCDHSNSQCCGDYNCPYGHNACGCKIRTRRSKTEGNK